MVYKVGIASSEGIEVDEHFGRAESFGIFTVDSSTGTYEFLEWRQTAESCGGEGLHDGGLERIAERMRDCAYVLVQRIGGRANAVLAAYGLHVIEASGPVAPALEKLNRYYNLQHKQIASKGAQP
jgi:nitrogen fixation protein NifX